MPYRPTPGVRAIRQFAPDERVIDRCFLSAFSLAPCADIPSPASASHQGATLILPAASSG
jgi:hypothetical protein